jgi:hypothetical protein
MDENKSAQQVSPIKIKEGKLVMREQLLNAGFKMVGRMGKNETWSNGTESFSWHADIGQLKKA